MAFLHLATLQVEPVKTTQADHFLLVLHIPFFQGFPAFGPQA